MSDSFIALIRTLVPMGVGALVSWLATLNIVIDDGAQAGLITFGTALISAIYYAIVKALEKKWPWFGWLLGVAKEPTYDHGE